MKMEYIRPLKATTAGPRGTVHAVLDDKITWCNWEYMTQGTLNGRPVPKASSDPGPMTCKRCSNRMMTLITYRMSKQFTPADMVELLDLSARLTIRTQQ